MTKSTNTNRLKRRADPLRDTRVMRSRKIPRPRVAFDGTVLCATATIAANALGAGTGRTLDYHFLNCSNTVGIARLHNVIANSYQEYRFKKVRLEWIPAVGPADSNARCQVNVGWTTNPEMMSWTVNTATSTTITNEILTQAKPKIFNAWERVIVDLPMIYRKKWFDVNSVIGGAPTIDSYDRDSQMLVQIGIQNGDAATTTVVGSYRFLYELELRGLASNTGT